MAESGPEAVASTFGFNNMAVGGLVDGIEAEDLTRSFGPAKPALWQLGHLVCSRRFLGRRIGLEIPQADWEKYFEPVEEMSDPKDWPGKDVLLDDLQTTGAQVVQAISQLSDQQARKMVDSLFQTGQQEPLLNQV